MERRSVLQAGCLAAVGSLLEGCAKRGPHVIPPFPAVSGAGSLPPKFVVEGGKGAAGVQLFFHGLCAFVLPKSPGESLRVAMLNGYPDDVEHRHYASLLVPRDGVDLAKSSAPPAAVDSDHITYTLRDMSMRLSVDGVSSPMLRIHNVPVSPGCATTMTWDNFGWVLDMSVFFPTGSRRAWDKVAGVSQSQFETAHGSLEHDFNGKETVSDVDTVEWDILGKSRVLKQAVRLRVLEPGPVSLQLTPRSGGSPTSIVFLSQTQTVNAGILNLPVPRKMPQNPGQRLTDALAYYQMFDPSPLNPANPAADAKLGVPLWSKNPDGCTLKKSIECTCCPPSGI